MNLHLFFVYLFNGTAISIIVYAAFTKVRGSGLEQFYFPALVVKLTATISLGLLYINYYQGGDIIAYFEHAKSLSQLSVGDYFGSIFSETKINDPKRAIYFTRIVSLLIFITRSDFWIASVYFSLLSSLCTFYFLIHLNKIHSKILFAAVIAFLFFPSFLFWSSGLLKESLVFGCMMILSGLALKIHHKDRFGPFEIIISVFCLGLLVSIKYYIAAAFIPPLFMFIMLSLRGNMKPKKWYLALGFFALVMIFGLPLIHPNFEVEEFLRVVEIARNSLTKSSNPENVIDLYTTSNTVINSLVNLCILIFSGLFRPFLFDSLQFPSSLAVSENFFIVCLLITRFLSPLSIEKRYLPTVLLLVGYILVVTLFLTYSIPNLGTLSRFKVYYMPFFLLLLLINHPLINWLKGSRKKMV